MLCVFVILMVCCIVCGIGFFGLLCIKYDDIIKVEVLLNIFFGMLLGCSLFMCFLLIVNVCLLFLEIRV